MKQRNSTTTLLLSLFVPFYSLYWLYDTSKSLKQRGTDLPPFYMLVMPLIIMLIIVFGSLPAMAAANNTNSTPAVGILSLLLLVAYIVAIVVPGIYYYKFSKVISELSEGKLSSGILFILFLVFAPVAIYLIQEQLNSLTPGPSAPPVSPIA